MQRRSAVRMWGAKCESWGLLSATVRRLTKRLVKPASWAVASAVWRSQKGLDRLGRARQSKIHIEIGLETGEVG